MSADGLFSKRQLASAGTGLAIGVGMEVLGGWTLCLKRLPPSWCIFLRINTIFKNAESDR